MEIVTRFEDKITSKLGWPLWAFRTIEVLSCLVLIVSVLQQLLVSDKDSSTKIAHTAKFRLFQLQYLSVYLIIMLADWLQGTNMYTLYMSYGVSVGTLFLTGFLSSAIFGTFLGIYVDKWGRRLGCVIFCVLEIVINVLEHLPHMPTLIFGRILGGLSTSLLFSAFESWMVSEHRHRGFPEELLASTFAIASWGNGLTAIAAGIVAQFASDASGDIGPFQVAIALTVVCLILIIFWPENYGQSAKGSKPDKKEETGLSALLSSIAASTDAIRKSPEILLLGLGQAFFEGAVYTFVFLWVPTLLSVNEGSLPTGLVFSSFMLAMTLGGMLFGIVLPLFPGNAEALCATVYLVSAASMLVPAVWFSFWPILVAFLVLEAMVGMFFSCAAILRSRYYPEEMQSSIMSVFRLPLNVLVVLGTTLSDRANDIPSKQNVFGIILCVFLVAFALQVALCVLPHHLANVRTGSGKKSD